ncbi:MAG: metal ABC transporter permease [Planctomycetaceae bacterium]
MLGVFFGAGIVLTRLIQNSGTFGGRAGFDAVLFGAPASLLIQDVYLIAAVCLIVILSIWITYRLSVGVAFDTAFLEVQGLPTNQIDWLHLLLLTIAVVVGLPAIGVVMIVALLITPAATARLCSNRLWVILWLAAMLGGIASATGAYLSSVDARIPAGAAAVLVATAFFLLSLAATSFLRVRE